MIRKADVACPHCGHVQQEPTGVVSTFCRGCGDHFDVGARAQPKAAPSPAARLGPSRKVSCYRCGAEHAVSYFAKSTLCPSCGAAIEFGDADFSSNTSRPVDIRGRLTVREGASLNHSRIICTDARIGGRVAGAILCERSLEFLGDGRMAFPAMAGKVFIGKRARVEFGLPVECGELEVRGAFFGDVLCGGRVFIRKGGHLEGSVEAPTITVEKGGSWSGGGQIEPALAGAFPSMGLFLPKKGK